MKPCAGRYITYIRLQCGLAITRGCSIKEICQIVLICMDRHYQWTADINTENYCHFLKLFNIYIDYFFNLKLSMNDCLSVFVDENVCVDNEHKISSNA